MMTNIVYIATSLDGFIADKNGNLDWLNAIPNPEQSDFGWAKFLNSIDAIVMGRKTFEAVCGFDCPWPYPKPVYVVSNSLKSLKSHSDKATLIQGAPSHIVNTLHSKGYRNLYIDGGITIKHFLEENLIDEMVITTIPILLGGGTPLFSGLKSSIDFNLIKSEVILNSIVKNHYQRINNV